VSGPKSIYTRSRVFVHPSLVAESPRKNAFPYDELASGRGVYGYVGGNPASSLDPLGLYALVTQSGNNVQIQIPISYVGATSQQVQGMNNAIQAMWTGQFGQYNVTTIVTTPDPAAAPNQINTVTVVPGSAAANPAGYVVGGNEETVVGAAVDAYPSVAAHEAGHLMGLPDAYNEYIDQSGNRTTQPWPGYANDIMATLTGKPTAADIAAILRGPRGFSIPHTKSPSSGSCE
jgi:hypothetical protein